MGFLRTSTHTQNSMQRGGFDDQMDRRSRRMVQHSSDLLGMQRNNMETRRKVAHLPSYRDFNVQSCPLVDLWGVLAMRINRTFSLPVSLAIRLKSCRNQSSVVSKAVKKYLDEKQIYSLGDIETRVLLSNLTSRNDTPEHIRVLIQQYFRDNKRWKPSASHLDAHVQCIV